MKCPLLNSTNMTLVPDVFTREEQAKKLDELYRLARYSNKGHFDPYHIRRFYTFLSDILKTPNDNRNIFGVLLK